MAGTWIVLLVDRIEQECGGPAVGGVAWFASIIVPGSVPSHFNISRRVFIGTSPFTSFIGG